MDHLAKLGFSPLEATAYLALLAHSPMTGYAVAKAISSNKSNTYKALESLASKGAVERSGTKTTQWRAVPHRELLDRLERRWQQSRSAVADHMDRIAQPSADQRLYSIQEPQAALQRARSMIDQATDLVLVDGFPAPLEAISPELVAASERGLRVAVRHYALLELKGIRLFPSELGENVIKGWGSQWLGLVIDAEQCLVAHFSANLSTIEQAIWTRSAHLSMVIANGMGAEMVLGDLIRSVQDGDDPGALIDQVQRDYERFCARGTPGQRHLLERRP